MRIPLVLVGDRIATQPSPLSPLRPRQDYEEIALRLGGKLSGGDPNRRAWYTLARKLEKRMKLDLLTAMRTAKHASEYSAVLSTSEKLAIPMAAISSVMQLSIPHIVIAHKLSSGLKTHLFRLWPLHKRFSHIITVSRKQADYAVTHLGFSTEQVDFVYDKVDHLFFHPQPEPVSDYVLAVGREQRDYRTLISALEGTDLRLIILASSAWSDGRIYQAPSAKVTYINRRIPFTELRRLYAGARVVVVPLQNVDYAAGINSVLEAMSMARPLVVSQTPTLLDYITDGETGLFATPGNIACLRHQILTVWHDSQLQKRLAANARQAVEQSMNLDIYVDNIAEITNQVANRFNTATA